MKNLSIVAVAMLLASVLLTSCTGLVCRFQDRVTMTVSDKIADTLQCANRDAVYADVKAGIASLGLCKQSDGPTGPLADVACPVVSQWVVSFVIDKAVPASWGCQLESAKATLAAEVEQVCKLIPLSPKGGVK